MSDNASASPATGEERLFNVPADFSTESLDAYVALAAEHPASRVAETYGNLTSGVRLVSSGRPVENLPQIDLDRLSAYVQASRERGIGFAYTFNATHYHNVELTRAGIAEFKNLLHTLHEMGVECLIVALPQLFEIIRSTGLDFRIKASVLAQITTANRAAVFRRLGADKIVADEFVTRDFDALRRIQRAFGGAVELIVNPYCHRECHYRFFHYNQMAFSKEAEAKEATNTYFPNRCLARLFDDPTNALKRAWIRPEDLHHYTDIGIRHFKLQGRHLFNLNVHGREMKGDIVKAVAAYMAGAYEGDLNDLIFLFNPAYDSVRVPLDNSRLAGFLQPFVDGKLVCHADCESCHYCEKIAKDIIDMDAFRQRQEMMQSMYKSMDEFACMTWGEAVRGLEHFPL